MKRVILIVLVAIFASPGAGRAQPLQHGTEPGNSASSGQQPANSAPSGPQNEDVDVTKLGISLDRIRRELGKPEANEQTANHGLKIAFLVEVYGQAPKIDFFENFPLTGPVPYGAPTHQEVLDHLTPKEFRSPVIPIYGMAMWAAQKLSERSKKQRCEDELAEYRRLVMSGVPVAAPRCSQ